MDPPTPIRKQGVWKVGRGQDIPINHPNWFLIKPDAPRQLADQITRVADLIDQDSVTWKSDLIMQLYDRNNTNQILGLPLPKTQFQNTQDQIIWPHSESGEYQVKQAYALLHQSQNQNSNTPRPSNNHSFKDMEKPVEVETPQQVDHLHLETHPQGLTN
uniref:Uncharacterized protein n=1 Tax=Fagus sylvatica TaxID=28930 RepID=A0A2N9FN32_FAGSY